MLPSRVFDHPNPINFLCPICKTKADRPVVLVALPGTESGNIVEAEQVHAECFRLVSDMISAPPITQARVRTYRATP
jgi:hypothetical protein